MIDGKFVILIGMAGADLTHTNTSELHPVYAMFVRTPMPEPTQEKWSFFVRNWETRAFADPTRSRSRRIRFRCGYRNAQAPPSSVLLAQMCITTGMTMTTDAASKGGATKESQMALYSHSVSSNRPTSAASRAI